MKKRIGTLVAVLAILAGTMYTGVALAANQAADLDQCANDPSPSPHTNGCAGPVNNWVNGNLGASKSVYVEGDSIPYRLRFTNLATGVGPIHHVIIEWDTTKAGMHALDYLTTYNASVADANPCVGVTGCSSLTPTTFAIPKDPQVDPGTPSGTGAAGGQPAGAFTFWGATISTITATSNNGYTYANGSGFAGDKSARIEINFTASVANPVLAWGGHIATRQAWGPTKSAVSIPGSPYHTRLISLDGAGGNQDRSLSAAAVIFPASITIVKDVVGGTDPQDFAYTETASPTLSPASFSLDDDANATLSNQQTYTNILDTGFITYTFAEGSVANWSVSFNTSPCTVSTPNGGTQSSSVANRSVTINLNEGENVTCTFLNTHTLNSPTVNTQVKTTGTDGAVGGGDDTNVSNGGHVAIGTEVYDTSTLSGGTANAGGSVQYYVEKGDATCTFDAVNTVDLGSKGVTNGTGAASNEYTFASAGTYYFWAVYSGDANNNGNTSGCSTELVVVDKNSPDLSTIPDPASGAIGDALGDSADLSGETADASGNITFWLFAPGDDCSDVTTAVYTETVASSGGSAATTGTGTGDSTATQAGTYHWAAHYAGDANNNSADSPCGDEPVEIAPNNPDISTVPSLQVRDAVTIGNLAPVGTFGNLTVKLVNGSDCNGTILSTQVWYGHDKPIGGNAFTGNGTYTTSWVTVSADATLRWCSAYEGDANNAARPFADDNEVIAIDFFPLAQAAAIGFAFAIPMLLVGAWRRRREDRED
jgi:hypothetical protein